MSGRKSVNSENTDLSLSGSHIHLISPPRRPTVAKQLKNATDTERRSKRSTSARSNHSLNTDLSQSNSNTDPPRRKPVAGGSTCSTGGLSTGRSNTGFLSERNKEYSRKTRPKHVDFLSIFESNVQPKIKQPESSKPKRNPSVIDSLIRSTCESCKSPRSVPDPTNMSHTLKRSDTSSLSATNNFPDHNRRERLGLSSDESLPEHKMGNFLSQSFSKPHSSYTSKNRLPDYQPGNSPYLSEDGELLYSQCPSSKFTRKSHSLNSIANNMTSQAMSPQAKASLSSIENSYRNIKPKTPVNQVKKESNQMELQSLAPADSTGATATPSQSKANSKENTGQQIQINAANKIQRWYRRHYVRKKAGEAAMRRLLSQKRQEKIVLQQIELEQMQQEKKEMEQKQMDKKLMKEIKAKETRQEVIKDMQKKRAEKDQKVEIDAAKYSSVSPVSSKSTSRMMTSVKQSNLHSSNLGARSKQPSADAHSSNGTCTPRNMCWSNVESKKKKTTKLSPENINPKEKPSSPVVLHSNGSFNQLTELQMTKACDDQLEQLFKETSKLMSVANSTIGQVTKSSSYPPFSAEQLASNDQSPDTSVVTGSLVFSKNGLLSKAPTKSTLSDLLDTLKKLEEDEKLATPKMDVNKNSYCEIPIPPMNDVGAGPSYVTQNSELPTAAAASGQDSNGSNRHSPYLTAAKLEQLNQDQDVESSVASGGAGFLSNDKLQSIISFLDEVQTADRLIDIDTEINRVSSEIEEALGASTFLPSPPLPPLVADEKVKLENASATAGEITNHVLAQKLELDEKKQSMVVLQKALSQQRELTVRHAKEAEKEMKHRLTLQKNEYEQTIKRHLSFIDQLIDDKKTLNEKCEQLVKEIKLLDKKYQDRFKMQDESHSVEMKKLKEMNAAAEKLRRERWIEDKTKKIKEMTVKGLEPEIQRLIAKHKSELRKFKQIHEAELLEADERAAQRYVKMTEDLRSQLAKEKEEACMHERELARQRYEKQVQQEEEAFQNERRRLYSEIEVEKKRLASQSLREQSEVDRLQQQLQNNHQQLLQTNKEEFEKNLADLERRHKVEIRELREKLALEKAAWEENFMKKQETSLLAKERELKEKVRRDRDKEIELVISRLEEDATNARDECERTAQNRIKRIRDKCESEVRELERSEKQAIEKYNEIKAKLTETEGTNEQLKVKVKQKTYEIDDLKKMLEKFHHERDHISDVVRQEFVEKIVSTEEENKRLKNETSEIKARHRIEIERGKAEIEKVKKQKDDELEELHKRVKQAIVKKEEIVSQLKVEYQAAVKRADHLEALLEQQRKQLLGK